MNVGSTMTRQAGPTPPDRAYRDRTGPVPLPPEPDCGCVPDVTVEVTVTVNGRPA